MKIQADAARLHLGLEPVRDLERQQVQDETARGALDGARALDLAHLRDARQLCGHFAGPTHEALRDAVLGQRFQLTAQRRHGVGQFPGPVGQLRWAQFPGDAAIARRQHLGERREALIDCAQRKLESTVRGTGFGPHGREDLGEAARATAGAEELHGQIRQLVGFIDNHRIGGAEHVTEAVLLQRQVRQQQVMVDDHHLRLERLAARLHQMAARVFGAARSEAVVPRRGDLRPQRMRVGEIGNLGQITGGGARRPGHHALEGPRGRLWQQRAAAQGLLQLCLSEPMHAQVIAAALENGDIHRHAQRTAEQGQVLVVELILQGAGAGGHQHPQSGLQHRHQITEGLAGAGARLDHERPTLRQGVRDALGHVQLLAARNEPLQGPVETAPGIENVF